MHEVLDFVFGVCIAVFIISVTVVVVCLAVCAVKALIDEIF